MAANFAVFRHHIAIPHPKIVKNVVLQNNMVMIRPSNPSAVKLTQSHDVLTKNSFEGRNDDSAENSHNQICCNTELEGFTNYNVSTCSSFTQSRDWIKRTSKSISCSRDEATKKKQRVSSR